jgi:peptide-methionine (S)-S-oxide reductase
MSFFRKAAGLSAAEDYHQQYLAKNPHGYCGIGGAGVVFPIGVGVEA